MKLGGMFHKRQLLVSTAVGLIGLPGLGAAAELPVKAPATAVSQLYSWTGPYLGGNVGYVWTAHSGVGCDFTGTSPCNAAGAPALNTQGVSGGLQTGYNWQSGSWLLGLEADIAAMNVRDVGHFAGADPNYNANAQVASRFDWLGTARGRAGFAVDRSLFYATGGFAYGRVTQQYSDTQNGAFSTGSTQTGWTVGGGYQYALDDKWSFKAEYLYVNLKNSSLTLPFPNSNVPGVTTLRFPNELNVVRLGLNYRF
jgi:outer membrane immunogenic protein